MRKAGAALVLGLAAAALIVMLAATGALERAEEWLYDWRMRQTADGSRAHPDIMLVVINDQTIRDMAPVFGRWPWPRFAHSLLIDFLSRAPARVVAFDVGIWERDLAEMTIAGQRWTGADSDAALVEAVGRSGRTILLADTLYGAVGAQENAPAQWRDPGYRLAPAMPSRPSLLPPIQELTDAAAALGHNYLPLDPEGTARRMPPFVCIGDRCLPSLGIAAALQAARVRPEEVALERGAIRVRDQRIPLVTHKVDVPQGAAASEQLAMMIRYSAPPGASSYPVFEARALMAAEDQIRGGSQPALDPAVFRDKIVFIGTTAAGAHDVFQTPFGKAQMPGIQLHASMADSLLTGRFIRPAPAWVGLIATILAGVVTAVLATFLPYRIGLAVVVALTVGIGWLSVPLFRAGHWINLVQPLAAVALSVFGSTAYRYLVEDREKRKVQKLFGRYVSRDVYAQLMAHPEQAELGGARREMSVLFSDIRGFTAVTERGDPEALVAQLNVYFSRMVDIVFRHGGTVDKFVGDMVMALFGAPLPDARHADHAVLAAIDMVQALGELNRTWQAEGKPTLDIGIGVNSGEMIAGNIGSSSIMSYTVIGDNVNLGSRLESLNKDYKTRIIISDATRTCLSTACDLRPLGDVVVKGKTRPVAIFEVKVPSPLPSTHEEALR
jgi:adenylate cyclase